jgi:hypothetical protein
MLYCRGLKFKKAEVQARYWMDNTNIRECNTAGTTHRTTLPPACVHVLFAMLYLHIGPDQILSQQATAGLLRPAYVLIKDEELKMVVLCIRGTQSMKDLFTSLTGICSASTTQTRACLLPGVQHSQRKQGCACHTPSTGWSCLGLLAWLCARWVACQVAYGTGIYIGCAPQLLAGMLCRCCQATPCGHTGRRSAGVQPPGDAGRCTLAAQTGVVYKQVEQLVMWHRPAALGKPKQRDQQQQQQQLA